MTGEEFRALRLQAGCSIHEWSWLLGAHPGSLRNIEGGSQQPGGTISRLAWLLAEPRILRLARKRIKVLEEKSENPIDKL